MKKKQQENGRTETKNKMKREETHPHMLKLLLHLHHIIHTSAKTTVLPSLASPPLHLLLRRHHRRNHPVRALSPCLSHLARSTFYSTTQILMPRIHFRRRLRLRCPSPSSSSTYHHPLQTLHCSFKERVCARFRHRSIPTRHSYPTQPNSPNTLPNSANNR